MNFVILQTHIRSESFIDHLDIWKAAKDGDLDMVRIQLRQNESELQGRTKYRGNTPMHMAAKNGHYLVVKYLLERGADSQITNFEEQTPRDLLVRSLTAQSMHIKKLQKKQDNKKKAQELQTAMERQKSMQDTLELLNLSEQAMMGGQRA